MLLLSSVNTSNLHLNIEPYSYRIMSRENGTSYFFLTKTHKCETRESAGFSLSLPPSIYRALSLSLSLPQLQMNISWLSMKKLLNRLSANPDIPPLSFSIIFNHYIWCQWINLKLLSDTSGPMTGFILILFIVQDRMMAERGGSRAENGSSLFLVSSTTLTDKIHVHHSCRPLQASRPKHHSTKRWH